MRWLFIILLLVGCEIEPNRVIEYSSPIELYFCPQDGCGRRLASLVESSSTIHCALHDLDIPYLQESFFLASARSEVKILLDDNYRDGNDKPYIRFDNRNQISHNKFCILDKRIVWTGSFNPTVNGDTRNHNDVLVIRSSRIADFYEGEFETLWNGIYGDKKIHTGGKRFVLNDDPIEIYFCPQDFCAQRVIEKLVASTEEILFMTFSFTHDEIAQALTDQHSRGIDIKGVMESSQNSRYSVFDKLNASGINVKWEHSPAKLHHKAFIIDSRIVITGSMNPSANGDLRNDENIIIIENKQIAQKYKEEFKILFLGGIGPSEIV